MIPRTVKNSGRVLRKGIEVLRREGLVRAVSSRLELLWKRKPKADDFDACRGVDTSTAVDLWNLNISSADWLFGVGYKPISVEVFETVLAHLPINPAEYTFIDLGSGKGRALILADEKGFRRVIGVEFSPELCAIAHQNLAGHVPGYQVLCQSARDFAFPEEPCVVFLYNPFGPEILADVLQHLRPDSYVAYVNPKHAQIVENFRFENIYSTKGLSIWRYPTHERLDEFREWGRKRCL